MSIISCAGHKEKTLSEKELIEKNSKEFNEYLESKFNEEMKMYPTYQTYLGMKTDYDKLNDFSEDFFKKQIEMSKKTLEELEKYKKLKLNHQSSLSLKLLEQNLENEIADKKWHYYGYPVNQMFGFQ